MTRDHGAALGPTGRHSDDSDPAFRVRPMVEADASSVARLAAALSAHEGAPPPPLDANAISRWAFGDTRHFEGLVAEKDAVVVGYLLHHDAFQVGNGGPGLVLMDLYVDDTCRGQGIGFALMASLAKRALEKDATWIAWQVDPENVDGMAFYRAIGGRRYRAADFEIAGSDLRALANKSR